MNIIVFNCGSSSLTYRVYSSENCDDLRTLLKGKAHRVGVKGTEPSFIQHEHEGTIDRREVQIPDHATAANLILDKVGELGIDLHCIGHRWGHGLGQFTTTFLSTSVLEQMKLTVPLLPIHHPAMLDVISTCRRRFPHLPDYVTTDNAFHAGLPACAYTYAIPRDMAAEYKFRKYGFHGLSYQYVVAATSEYLELPLERLKIIACHLGTGGSSVAAVRDGSSIDTSMGFSGLSGLLMSTRAGDIDPMLAIYLMVVFDLSSGEVIDLLNKKSGLLGMSGFSSDIRDIIKLIASDEEARLAFDMYVHRVKKYIGSYCAALGGFDVLVFTDDIGQHNWLVREKVCRDMAWCGLELDEDANRETATEGIRQVSTPQSRVCVLVVPTDEERIICLEGLKLMGGQP